MKLSDVRKLAVRQQLRVRFRLSDGTDCVVMEDGIARMPGIKDVPQLDLETEFAAATQLQLENVAVNSKTLVAPRTVSRAELEKLAMSHPSAAVTDDHDE